MRHYIAMVALLMATALGQLPRSAYTVNTLGEDLSIIDLEAGVVSGLSVPLGLFTNQVVVRGEQAFVINSGENEVQIIDLTANATVDEIDLGSGTNPYHIVFVDDQTAAVSLLFTNQVAMVNVGSGTIIELVDVGVGPEGLCFADGKVYVANSGFNGAGYDPGVVSVIDVENYSVSEISVGTNPQALSQDADGNIVVACTGNYADVTGQMDIIDPLQAEVVASVVANTAITNVVVTPSNLAYVATFGFGVLVYDLEAGIFLRDTANPLAGGPGLAIDSDEHVYVTDFGADLVHKFDTQQQLVTSYAVGDGPVSIAVYDPALTSIDPSAPEVVTTLELAQNYPNPFNPATSVEFGLPNSGPVRLSVHDLLGREVARLMDEELAAGTYRVGWDGRSDSGTPVASGMYYYRLTTPDASLTRAMNLVR